ncbi:MAG: hypothetical protein QGH47_04530 [Candidatus Woesearchaeota archaeon]|jgi:hypothetical protein|nr:hypothetical protein [Candidatus Woesearchaeota archaeon]
MAYRWTKKQGVQGPKYAKELFQQSPAHFLKVLRVDLERELNSNK